MRILSVLVICSFLLGSVVPGIIPCASVYDYGTDEELKMELLENGKWLEGPEVSNQGHNIIL